MLTKEEAVSELESRFEKEWQNIKHILAPGLLLTGGKYCPLTEENIRLLCQGFMVLGATENMRMINDAVEADRASAAPKKGKK